MQIAHFSVKKQDQIFLKEALKGHDNIFFEDNDIAAHLPQIKSVEVLCVFIYDHVSSEIIASLPNLKLIATRSTGFDHIDLNTANESDVKVANVPFYGENTIAEHAFALLLSLSKNIPQQIQRTKNADFNYLDLPGFDLSKKTIGVVGTGNIGMHTIKIAKGFGMKVIAFDVVKNKFLEEVLGFEYVSLPELLSQSQIISLHAPYNKHTHHMLDKAAFEKMQTGVTVINTSRGGLVNNQALIEALGSGKVLAAGLDVLDDEQELIAKGKDSYLFDLINRDNVIFTPHTAYYTVDAENRILQTTADNITAFLDQKPTNIVKGS
jgi:D-lactate dehydrogenase